MKTFDLLISKRGSHEFSSGCYTGEDFKAFARDFKATMKVACSSLGYTLIMGKPWHYYLSGFVKSGDAYVYFSISDVRWSRDRITNVLVRSAKSDKDFSGGHNGFTGLVGIMGLISDRLAARVYA